MKKYRIRILVPGVEWKIYVRYLNIISNVSIIYKLQFNNSLSGGEESVDFPNTELIPRPDEDDRMLILPNIRQKSVIRFQ